MVRNTVFCKNGRAQGDALPASPPGFHSAITYSLLEKSFLKVQMKQTITKEMIEIVQKAIRNAQYDGDKFSTEVAPLAPCSVTQAFFPEIIDLALQHLKIKASHSLVEYIENEQKTNNIEVIVHSRNARVEQKLKNKPLPMFDWNLIKS